MSILSMICMLCYLCTKRIKVLLLLLMVGKIFIIKELRRLTKYPRFSVLCSLYIHLSADLGSLHNTSDGKVLTMITFDDLAE